MTKRERTNNDLQNTLQKTKDRATRTCSTSDISRVKFSLELAPQIHVSFLLSVKKNNSMI